MTDVLYWIWLQNKLGYASKLAIEVIRHPGGARFFYESTESQLRELGIFPDSIILRLRDHSLDYAETVYIRCMALGYFIITPDNNHYPMRLRRIEDPPLVLYVNGNLSAINVRMSIAIVGTREASNYNLSVAEELGYRLGKAGAAVISGCAVGIDAASQSGAIAANGITVGVLGCGLDFPYNRRTQELRSAITVNGALISEYPPGVDAHPYHFPQRNRIISGLSLGVTVIQAGKKSGSLITAKAALEQGRDLFVYYSESNLSTLASIRSVGESNLSLIVSPSELLEPYMESCGNDIHFEGTEEPLRSRPDVMPQNIDSIISAMAAKAEADQRLAAMRLPNVPGSFKPIADTLADEVVMRYDDLPSEEEAAWGKVTRSEHVMPESESGTAGDEADSDTEHNNTSSNINTENNENQSVFNQIQADNHLIDQIISSAEKIGMSQQQIAALVTELEGGEESVQTNESKSERKKRCKDSSKRGHKSFAQLSEEVSEEARRLYAILCEHPDTIDNLAVLTGMTVPMTAEFMLELELYGHVYSKPGGIYAAADFFTSK